MRKRASSCWLQLCTVGSYHPRPQFSQNLACPQGTKSKPSIGANRHTSQHCNGVSAAAGAPGTDAAADALAAVGVNCSSSSELSACWLARCSTNRRLWLKQRACCFTYVLSLVINAVDHTIPSNNTRITLNAYVCSSSTPSFSGASFSSSSLSSPANYSPANSTPATSSVIFQSCNFQSCKFRYPLLITDAPSTPATMSKQRSTVLPVLTTMSNAFFVKFRPFDKVTTNWTCSICFDFAERKKLRSTLLPKNGNNVEATFDFVEATFDFVERIVRLVAFDNVASTLLLV